MMRNSPTLPNSNEKSCCRMITKMKAYDMVSTPENSNASFLFGKKVVEYKLTSSTVAIDEMMYARL